MPKSLIMKILTQLVSDSIGSVLDSRAKMTGVHIEDCCTILHKSREEKRTKEKTRRIYEGYMKQI